jgi:hypothetical protein
MKRLLLVFGFVSAAGCDPYLTAITPAPPLRVLELDAKNDRIELSEATAVAFECYRESQACRDVHASVEPSDIAAVYSTHLAGLDRAWMRERDTNVSTLTLVGLTPGTTRLRVTAEGWTHEYSVTVLAAR